MAALVSAEELGKYTRSLFFPLMLMLNFSFFQYLVLLFHARWRQKRVQLLLLVSATSVVVLVPFATQTDETIANLNDVSESCLALILLVQTALVGSRSTKEQPSLRVSKPLQLFADALIVFDCAVVVLGLVCVFRPRVATDFGGTAAINNVAENLTLAFTFIYRFGELGHMKGWRKMVRDDKWELAFHVVFMLHEYPFIVLERATHVSWEYLQAIFMRLALTPCVWMTIGEHHTQRLSVFLDLQRMPPGNVKEILRRASLEIGTSIVTNKSGGAPATGALPVSSITPIVSSKSGAVVHAAADDTDDVVCDQERECSVSRTATRESTTPSTEPRLDEGSGVDALTSTASALHEALASSSALSTDAVIRPAHSVSTG